MKNLALLTCAGALLVAAVPLFASAQGGGLAPSPAAASAAAPSTISVSGTTQVTMAPDIAYLRVGVSGFDKDRKRSVADAAARTESVLKAIRAAGIPAADVGTDVLAIGEASRYIDGQSRTAIEARRDMRVVVRDLGRLEPLITAVLDAGANTVGDIRFDHTEMTQRKQAAREKAVVAARDKARAMAGAIGQDIGRAVHLSEEGSTNATGLAPVYMNEFVRAGGATVSGQTLETGEIQVTVTIYADFELR